MPASPTWLRQVHGADVIVVGRRGEHAGTDGDALVTAAPGCALMVRTADCAPVVVDAGGAVGLVHAGWRGLLDGVIRAACAALVDLGHEPRAATIGPCIRPGCYEFGGPELDAVTSRFGAGVRATTAWGTRALDLPAAVVAALADAGVTDVRDDEGCTACDTRWYSHRARGDTGRVAAVAWLEP
ncbi:MAG: polyphenol oxidase family protein [Acidimicrobiales bacterium]